MDRDDVVRLACLGMLAFVLGMVLTLVAAALGLV
jgi:hypothetical protein